MCIYLFELVHFPLELVVKLLEAALDVVVEHLDVVEAQVLELLRLVLLLLDPFLQQRVLVDRVAGTENVALNIEPASTRVGPSGLLASGFEFDTFDESDVLRRTGSMADPQDDLRESIVVIEEVNSDNKDQLGAAVQGGLSGPTSNESWWFKIAM